MIIQLRTNEFSAYCIKGELPLQFSGFHLYFLKKTVGYRFSTLDGARNLHKILNLPAADIKKEK